MPGSGAFVSHRKVQSNPRRSPASTPDEMARGSNQVSYLEEKRMSRQIFSTSGALLAGALAFMLLAQVCSAQDSHPKFDFFAEGGVSATNHFTAEYLGVISFQPPQFALLQTRSSLRTTGRLFAGVRLWLDKSQALEASYSYSPSALVSSLTCVPACP